LYDIVQITGSLLILAAFIASLFGRAKTDGYPYLIVNAVGSGVLACTAIVNLEWGFILLEGVWSLVSIVSIVRKARGRSAARAS
jgi:hypothetical protein